MMIAMKLKTSLAVVLAVGFIQPALSNARDLFQLSWRGTCYTTDGSGRVVAKRYTEKEIIAKAATDNGLDPRSLAFVYDATEGDTEVVVAATGEYVSDVFQLETRVVAVPSADGNQTVRQMFIFNEAHGEALGSAFGIERAKHGPEGQLLSLSYKGSFQFSIPEDDAVYSGTFTTGKRIKDTSTE
jgi:hypothetical protein